MQPQPPAYPAGQYPGYAQPVAPKVQRKLSIWKLVIFLVSIVLVGVGAIVVVTGTQAVDAAKGRRGVAEQREAEAANRLADVRDEQAAARKTVAESLSDLQQGAAILRDLVRLSRDLAVKQQGMIDSLINQQVDAYNTNRNEANAIIEDINAKSKEFGALSLEFSNA